MAPTCRAWSCPVCGPRKTVRLAAALENAGYDRTVTVTRAPSDLLQGVRRLRHRLAARGPFEWAWSAERGPKTGMLHIHAVVRGTWWEARGENAPMTVECRKAGWGFCAPRKRLQVAFYATKGAYYATKGRLVDYDAARRLNGGVKPWHWSKGYTGGVPMRDFVARNAPAKDVGPWTLVPARDLPWWLRWTGRNLEQEAEAIWPTVVRASLIAERDDAAEETIRRRLNADLDPAARVRAERAARRPRRENAFAGMPKTPWWK